MRRARLQRSTGAVAVQSVECAANEATRGVTEESKVTFNCNKLYS